MDAKVTWRGKLSFSGVSDSGVTVPLGGEVNIDGEEDGLRPMEMILIGLAGCTAMDVISILSKKRQDITAFDVEAHAARTETHPKVFTSTVLEYYVTGRQVDEIAMLRAIELSATRYCPAQAMLGKAMPIEMKYYIFENEEEGQRSLVKSGSYSYPAAQVHA